MNDHLDVIAAFADGEPVEADVLRSALADQAGREYLVDVLALRGLYGFGESRVRKPEPGVISAASPSPFRARFALPIAALLVAGVAGGFAMGRQAPVPASAGPITTPMVTAQATPPELRVPAPAPTRVIKLESGSSWNERSGGN